MTVKTPAPETAAGRKKLAAKGQALNDGTAPIPDLAYLRKAIRAKGRVDPAKWPALKALIRRRAKELGALNAPGVRGTWPFEGANQVRAIELVGGKPPYQWRHGWIRIGAAEPDHHIAEAKKAVAEGRHADAINHLTAAIGKMDDKSAAFHLTELRSEMAARQMGKAYKPKPRPASLHAIGPPRADDRPSAEVRAAMTPAEKRKYIRDGSIPDRLKSGAAPAAKAPEAPKREVTPGPATKSALVHHMTEHHSGGPVIGRKTGPRNPTAAQLKANHDEQHAVRGELGHTHAADPAAARDIAEQRRLVAMWTRAFRHSNRTQGELRDAQFTNELHRLLSTSKPPSKMTPGARDAHDFLGMVDRGATPQPALYRGIALPRGSAAKMFRPGQEVDLPVASWGKTPGSADAFGGESGVILQMPPGAQGLDLVPIQRGGSAELQFRLQMQEVVTGGRFRVESVTERNGKTYVKLGRQAGGFVAH